MPCSADGPSYSSLEIRMELDKVTQLLCSAGRCYWARTEMPQEVLIWWEHHCVLDKKRGEPWDVEPKQLGVK